MKGILTFHEIFQLFNFVEIFEIFFFDVDISWNVVEILLKYLKVSKHVCTQKHVTKIHATTKSTTHTLGHSRTITHNTNQSQRKSRLAPRDSNNLSNIGITTQCDSKMENEIT